MHDRIYDNLFFTYFCKNAFYLQTPIEAVAMGDYQKEYEFGISVKKGECFFVIQISSFGWCYIQGASKQGICPCKHLQLKEDISQLLPAHSNQFYRQSYNSTSAINILNVATTNAGESTPPVPTNLVINNQVNLFFVNHEPNVAMKSSLTTSKRINFESNKPSKEPKGGRTCNQCGTNSTPEWRKGPAGHNTLCNACGLRFRKKNDTSKQARKPNTKTSLRKEQIPDNRAQFFVAKPASFQNSLHDASLTILSKDKSSEPAITSRDTLKPNVKSSISFIIN